MGYLSRYTARNSQAGRELLYHAAKMGKFTASYVYKKCRIASVCDACVNGGGGEINQLSYSIIFLVMPYSEIIQAINK